MRASIVPAFACALAIVVSACDDGSPLPTGPTLRNYANTTVDGIGGRIRDTLGRPVPAVRVEIGDGPLAGRVATTDDDGRFMFASTLLSPDAVTLHVSKDGFSPVTARWLGRNDFFITVTALSLLNLSGRYAITFTAAPTCSQLPVPLRSRTYAGLISPTSTVMSGFTTGLSDADFFPAYSTFSASVASDAARINVYSWDAFRWWLEDQPIIERVGPTGFLAFMGTAHTPVVRSTAAFTAPFDGSITYCSAFTPPARDNFPPTCAVPVECRSDRHQITFTRR